MGNFKSKASLLTLFITLGCAEFIEPQEGWNDPVDLDLNNHSLKDKVIGLECGWEENRLFGTEEKWVSWRAAPPAQVVGLEAVDGLNGSSVQDDQGQALGGSGVSCFGMAQVIKSLGATLWDPDSSVVPDFKVRYLDRGLERDYCGWTLGPYLLTATLFPCVESLKSQATLTLKAQKGQFQRKIALGVDIKAIYGVGAFYFLGVEFFRPTESQRGHRKLRLARDTLKTIQNHLYSFQVRLSDKSLVRIGGQP